MPMPLPCLRRRPRLGPSSAGLALLLACLALAACGGASASASGDDVTQGDATDAVTGPKAVDVTGCDGAALLAWPAAPGLDEPALLHGPWPVGARTLTIAGLTTEVWYPARPGSEAGVARVAYDLRTWLPESEKAKIPDAKAPKLDCDCHRDLPLDDGHGPYPAIVFIHGTAGFRAQSMSLMTAWASHGFVVVAADHPLIVLSDALQLKLGADQPGDARKLLAALRARDPALGDLGAAVAIAQLAVAGHSAGGNATGQLGGEAGVRVAMPMAAGGVDPAHPVTATVVLGGVDDGIVPFAKTIAGFEASKGDRWLLGLAGAGHLAFSDLCVIGAAEGGLLGVAETYGITLPPGTGPLFAKLATDGCKPGQMQPERGWRLSVAATLPVLRQTLHCQAGAAAAVGALTGVADVSELRTP